MKRLLEYLLLIIIKKIATFGAKDLLRFKMTSKYHQRLAHEREVLKVLSQNCLWYLTDYWPIEGKHMFMKQFSRSGHAVYSVATTAQML